MGRAQNLGRYFENLIYLDLSRKVHDIYYYLTKSRREVDFLTRNGHGQWQLYQVCWDIQNPETYQREVTALQEAEQELGFKGNIITPDTYVTLGGAVLN